jgi:hypothetical protein
MNYNVDKINSWLKVLCETPLVMLDDVILGHDLDDCALLSVLKIELDRRCFDYSKINFSAVLSGDFSLCGGVGSSQNEVNNRVGIQVLYGFDYGDCNKCRQ